MESTRCAGHTNYAWGLRPALYQGSHATAARLGQRGWLTERIPTTALARASPRSASTCWDLGGLSAPKNKVAFLATSGTNFCGYRSGAKLAGGEQLAQRPEDGPPQGAAALARAQHERALEEGRTRVREENCFCSMGWSGKVPGHTWVYLWPPALYLARQRCRGKSASADTYGDGAP